MPSHRKNWFEGWRLFAVLTLVLAGLCIWIAGMRQFEVDGVRMQGPTARLSRTPAVIRHAGRALGADTDEVLTEVLRMPTSAIKALRRDGVIE